MLSIVKHRKIYFLIPAVIILAGLIASFFVGFNQDVEFIGGTAMYVNMGKVVDNAEVESVARGVIGNDFSSIQKTGDGTELVIKSVELSLEKREELFKALQDKYNLDDAALIQVDSVGATVGSELKRNATIAAIIAIVLMLVYISIRFEILSGCAAICCLIHDVLIMLAFYIFFQIPINTSFIAALLTIIGYSINATIVLFDRIRENTRLSRKETFVNIVEASVKQTLGRSINTSLTTLITLVILYFMGVSSIKEFALPIVIGIVAGTYSSVFLSGNFWYLFKKMRKDKNVA